MAEWGRALTRDADILIYGCDVAGSDEGVQLVRDLAVLTGADVAASDDLTGDAAQDGDWNLEYRAGAIEATVALSATGQQNWQQVLDITTGLKGHWKFDANAADSSGNNYNGTLTGNAAIDTNAGTNKVGAGKLTLDGTLDYVDLTTHRASFTSLSQGTISAWVKTATTGEGYIVSADNTSYDRAYTSLFVYQNKLNFWVANQGTYVLQAQTTVSVNDNNWHHVAVTVDGSGNKLYIDGIEKAVTYSTGSASMRSFFSDVTGIDFMSIGIDKDNTGLSGSMNGLLDDVRIYDRALTAGDISQLASNAPVNTLPSAQSTNEDTALIFSSANGNQISIDDSDAGSKPLGVTLSVNDGVLTLSGTTGLTFTGGGGNGSTTMTFSGTLAAINSALDGLTFTPNANFTGAVSLQMTTHDDTGLVGSYSFDDTTNSTTLGKDDGPGTANNGVITGGASYVNDATRGNVLSLDGVDDGVQIPGLFGEPANVTLSAWINFTGTQRGEIISLGDSLLLRINDPASSKSLRGIFYDGTGWQEIYISTAIANTGWHHVAYTFDDVNNRQKLYLDGVEVASGTATESIDYFDTGDVTFSNSTIGRHPNPAVTTTNFFKGLIDDARIYDRALSAAEITAVMNYAPGRDSDVVAITVTAVERRAFVLLW